jgi:hypothetical protein
MSNEKVVYFKNPGRKSPEVIKSYVPQYKELDIEPEEFKSAIVSTDTKIAKPTSDNPRLKRATIRQDYAEVAQPNKVGKLPNVGNNVEQSWSSIDGDIIDDLELDPNHQMIDNNYVEEKVNKKFITKEELQEKIENDIYTLLQELNYDDYLLLVDGIAICSGPLLEIQEQVSLLVFGEHEMCAGTPVDINNIVVVKKSKIKTGVFVE